MPVVFHFGDQSISIHVEESWSILYLKQFVCMKFKCDPHTHLLSYKGTQLIDWEKVPTYDFLLRDGSSVDVLPHKNLNHFYVLCYSCDNVTPAIFTTRCDRCDSLDFTVSTGVANPEIKTVSGTCNNCKNTNARVEIRCSNDVDHSPALFLQNVSRNLDKLVCIACCSGDSEIVIKFCDSIGHVLCLECFRSYSESYLSDARFEMVPDVGLTLSCPVGCPNSHITDTHLFRVLGKAFYSNYKATAAKLFCYTENYFPCPNCGAFWERPNFQSRTNWFVCERPLGCGVEFCSRCNNVIKSDNSGCICSQTGSSSVQTSISDQVSRLGLFGSWIGITINAEELAATSLIAATCKSCPRCKSKTEKDGGCNHMTCSICRFEWCWICQNEWSQNCQGNHWF